jgi:hypothetical protein
MNRSLSLHPLSLVLGLASGVLILVSMSQAPPLNARNVNVQYLPDPRDYVQIREGVPYTVPAGKLLVMTALGQAALPPCGTEPPRTALKINGLQEATSWSGTCGGGGDLSSVIRVADGFTAAAGSIVEVESIPAGAGRIWAYLAPQ